MLAMLCSNPAATKHAIGGTIARMRAGVDRALNVSQAHQQVAENPQTHRLQKSEVQLALPNLQRREPHAAELTTRKSFCPPASKTAAA